MPVFVRDISHSIHHGLWGSRTSLWHIRFNVKLSTSLIIDNTEIIVLHSEHKPYKNGGVKVRLFWEVDNMKKLHYFKINTSLHK